MSKRLKPILGLMGLYLAFLIIQLPAQHSIGWLIGHTSLLSFDAIKGRLWAGSIQTLFFDPLNQGALAIKNVQWQFNPWALLAGEAQVSLSSRGSPENKQSIAATLSRSIFQSSAISDAQLELPASTLNPWLASPYEIRLGGDFSLNIQQFAWDLQQITQAEASFIWQDATLEALGYNVALGSFGAKLSLGPEGEVVAELFDVDAGISIKGQARWWPDNRYSLNLKVKPKADLDEKFKLAIVSMVAPDEAGFFPINSAGTLPFSGQQSP